MAISKANIQKIVKDDALFNSLIEVANTLIFNWEKQSCVRDSEWDTARLTIEKESKISALKLFLKELEELALK